MSEEHFGGMDVEAMLNARHWLEKALDAAGAERTGGGMGMGEGVVDIKLEGFPYAVSIRPLSSPLPGDNVRETGRDV